MRTLPPMHTSAETAYLVDDYPYGFTLRCRMYVWLEYRPKFGYRMVTQTTNPRRTGHVLNKPKAGIYHPLAVLFLDDNEHIHVDGLSLYRSLDEIDQFERLHSAGLQGEREQQILATMRKVAAAMEERARRAAAARNIAAHS